VCLDNRTIKTIYKDELYIPSRALAVALSEEWESQDEIIDL
jgi:chaperone required for assembly of F1-ATPase